MRLHCDLGVTQKTAWHLAHHIREIWAKAEGTPFTDPVKVDETRIGGKRKNMPKRVAPTKEGRGTAGKVAGAGDRATKRVAATDGPALQGFIRSTAGAGATIFTDDARTYLGTMGFRHEAGTHSVGEYMHGMAHTNGAESFWAMLKRSHQNARPRNTLNRTAGMAWAMVSKRLRYRDLVA